MNDLMLKLITTLTEIDERCGELTSTDIREVMFDYIWSGFLFATEEKPEHGDLYIDDSDIETEVWEALEAYVENANAEARAQGLTTFKQRLAAFQADVVSEEGMTYDEFFGWIDPEDFDEDGNPV